MSWDALDKEYYFTKDSNKSEMRQIITDCFILAGYVLFQDKISDEKMIPYLIDNLCIDLERQDGEYLFLSNTIFEREDSLLVFQTYKDSNYRNTIENLLDQGKPVIVQTITSRLKFSRNYNLDAPIVEDPSLGHAFILLHHDEDSFYYLEEPEFQINYENFISYKGRKDIGIIKKEEFYEVLELGVNLYTVELNEKITLEELRKEAVWSIRESIRQYKAKMAPIENGYEVIGGREVYVKYIEFLKEKPQLLSDPVLKWKFMNWYGLFHWQFGSMMRRRKILRLWLESLPMDTPVVTELIQKVYSAEREWSRIFTTIQMRYAKKRYEISDKLIQFFEKIIPFEDEMFELLEVFVNEYEKNM